MDSDDKTTGKCKHGCFYDSCATCEDSYENNRPYKIGDSVVVTTENGEISGKVVTVLPNYAWSGETKYSVHGKEFITIASARSMRSA